MRALLLAWVFAASTFAMSASQSPISDDWPQMYPPRAIAPGARTASGAEFQWRDGKWAPISRQQYRYDNDGRLASITYESDLNGTWVVSRRESCRYDAGRLVEVIVQESVGPTLQNRARHTRSWSNDRLAAESIDAWSYEQRWTPIRRTAFRYDPSGRRQFEELFTGGTTQPASRVEFRYDAGGRISEEIRQQPQGRTWVDTDRIARAYNAAGRPSTVSRFSRRGPAEWVESFRITHSDDKPTAMATIVTQVIGRNGLQDSQRQLLMFDAAGNQIETRFQGPGGGAWVDGRKETWTYER